ncbi:MAG: (Fe-S)-binding protein [Deferrisomatales bacterium]
MRPRRVSLFLTCSADLLYPSAGRACVEALEALGVGVDFPTDQTCCGQAWVSSGRPEEARRLARRFLEGFGDAEAIVAPSASCVDTVRNLYPGLFPAEPEVAEQARAVGARTFELCEYLWRVLGVTALPALPRPVRTTYHSSCRTLRGLGLTGAPEALLRSMLGDHFTELPAAQECCGFGGSFSVKLPEVSGRLLEEKLRHVRSTGAERVVSLDLGCLTHLAAGARRQGLGVRFSPFAALAAEALGRGAT